MKVEAETQTERKHLREKLKKHALIVEEEPEKASGREADVETERRNAYYGKRLRLSRRTRVGSA